MFVSTWNLFLEFDVFVVVVDEIEQVSVGGFCSIFWNLIHDQQSSSHTHTQTPTETIGYNSGSCHLEFCLVAQKVTGPSRQLPLRLRLRSVRKPGAVSRNEVPVVRCIGWWSFSPRAIGYLVTIGGSMYGVYIYIIIYIYNQLLLYIYHKEEAAI